MEVRKAVIGKIGHGFLVFIGIEEDDTEETGRRMVKKMTGLRIFEDGEGRTNLSLAQVGGSLLLVSQFTLLADVRKGNRPSFVRAGSPARAEELYRFVVGLCRESVPCVEEGAFGEHMKVSLVNDGPFTILMDSHELFGS